MKPIILHGENQVESRKKFSALIAEGRRKGLEIKRVDGKVITKGEFLTLSRSQTLLGEDLLIASENLLSDNVKGIEIASEAIKNTGTTFVFWERKKLSPAQVKKLEKLSQMQEFKIPANVFKFLDSLDESHNNRVALELLHEALKNSEPEFVFTMLARQLRLLIWAKLDPDTLGVPNWQKKKLVSQAKNFTADQLFSLHTKLLELDRMNKLSQLPENLSASLELLVVGL